MLRENGRLAPGELEREVYGEHDAGIAALPSFAVGDTVRVRAEHTHRTAWRRPHLRTPG